MSKVYITQVPHRKDKETGALIPSINISPAAEHGEIIIMLPPQAAFFATTELTTQLHNHLKHYDYNGGDSLIALGDPAVIAVACAILGKDKGHFIIQKWDRNLGRYIPTHVHV